MFLLKTMLRTSIGVGVILLCLVHLTFAEERQHEPIPTLGNHTLSFQPLILPNPIFQLAQVNEQYAQSSAFYSTQFINDSIVNQETYYKKLGTNAASGYAGSALTIAGGILFLIMNKVLTENTFYYEGEGYIADDEYWHGRTYIFDEQLIYSKTDELPMRSLGVYSIFWGALMIPSAVISSVWKSRIGYTQYIPANLQFDFGIMYQRQMNMMRSLNIVSRVFAGLFIAGAIGVQMGNFGSGIGEIRIEDTSGYDSDYQNTFEENSSLRRAGNLFFIFSLAFMAGTTVTKFLYYRQKYFLFSPVIQMAETEEKPSIRFDFIPSPEGMYGTITGRF